MIVDYSFYSSVYMGTEADAASFPALCARAEDVVGAMTHWQVDAETIGDFPEQVQTLYKKAICAQVDSFAVNGLDSVTESVNGGRGWSVGKVHVSGASGAAITSSGAMAAYIAPLAIMYLEQTGLMNPAVPAVESGPLEGMWW